MASVVADGMLKDSITILFQATISGAFLPLQYQVIFQVRNF